MALEIAAFGGRIHDASGGVNVFQRPGLGNQTVAISGASVASDPFPEGTRYVKLDVSADCRIAFGDEEVEADEDSEFFRAGEHTAYIGPASLTDRATHLAVISA